MVHPGGHLSYIHVDLYGEKTVKVFICKTVRPSPLTFGTVLSNGPLPRLFTL